MKDIRQIKVINKALENKKKMVINDIMALNKTIKHKTDLVTKIQRYQDEYQTHNSKGAFNTIPALFSNKYMFSGRIFELVERERKEIDLIKQKISAKMTELMKLEKKISSMEYFEQEIASKEKLKLTAREQKEMDEIINLNLIGEEND